MIKTPQKLDFFLSNFWGAVHFAAFFIYLLKIFVHTNDSQIDFWNYFIEKERFIIIWLCELRVCIHTLPKSSQNLYTQSVCTFWDDLNFGESPNPWWIIRDRKRKWYNKHTIVTVICSVQINELYLNFNFEKKGIKWLLII